ncbi:MAG: S41 family peptidase [Planctomycetota bacterium]|nr:S41 family peptidase [Planctomycetota bacterium]
MSLSNNLRSGVAFFLIGLTAFMALSPGNAGTPGSRNLALETRQAVNKGVELEQSRRWGDAIMHYEKSTKQWPDCGELEYGMRRSKVHFNVDRRYCDSSFQKSLLAKPRTSAIALFDDVINQAQEKYVEPLSLTSFIAHGTESLYQALDEPRFLENNVASDRHDRADSVRNVLRRPEEYWNRRIQDREDARRFIDQVCNLCKRELGMSATAVVLEYVFGGCNSLDDYSGMLTPGKYRDLWSNIHGEFVGLGVEINAEPGTGLLLVNVIPGSPAAAGGLLPGEHIVSIDGRDVRNLTTEEAATLLQGEKGSRVRLEVVRGAENEVRSLTLTRRQVVIQSIPVARMIDRANGVAFIQLASFQDSTVQELDAALMKLDRQGMKSLVLDVRGNPGGLLNAAVDVLDRFIEDGVLVSIKGRIQNEVFRPKQPGAWRMPIVLLIDGDSASASEIVAGAFKDHRRATIVGRRSFGKWSVQSILPAREKCGFRLTTAKFYSPKGQNLAKIGLRPDIEVPAPSSPRNQFRAADEIDVEGDDDIQQALRLLRNEVATK